MTVVLTNEEIDALLDMRECVAVLEQAYLDHARRMAVNRPRTDIYTPHERPDAFYVFKSFEGMLPRAGVVALRLNSDVVAWSGYAGGVRKDKIPSADGRWVGLVLLFSTQTGAPLAILPDGVIQRVRVGAANALAARLMARPDASVYGLLGAGWQAGAQLMALATVRDLSEVRVYSPNPESREAFAEQYGERLRVPVRAVPSAAAAAEGADIVGCATNATTPVVEPGWLRSGMHLTCVKRSELGEAALNRCDRVVVHTREGKPHNYLVGLGDVPVTSHDPLQLARRLREDGTIRPEEVETATAEPSTPAAPELSELLAGKAVGRANHTDINAFVNNIGLGIQFAAIGELAYRKATESGVGREIATDVFLESVHP